MGCSNSHVSGNTVAIAANPDSLGSTGETIIPLSTEQKTIVRETWKVIEPNKKDFGVNVYVRFLTEYPTFKSLFPEFKDIPLHKVNKRNVHVKRLVAALEKTVSSLDDVETFQRYLFELGRRHADLRIKPTKSQFRKLKLAVLDSMKEFSSSIWSSEAEDSWGLLFDVVASIMLTGINSTG
ncbi:globin-like [Montipora foliosa]|uniref:globin-like n=1 Tax=Montipora foliosa TaxID=591990 RepID=UPI0035F1509B